MLTGVCISVLLACDLIFNSKVGTELYPHFWEYEYTIRWCRLLSVMNINTTILQITDYQPIVKGGGEGGSRVNLLELCSNFQVNSTKRAKPVSK